MSLTYRYAARPEVLTISVKKVFPRDGGPSFHAFECEHMDELIREVMSGNTGRAGSIVHWPGSTVPIEVVRLFDYVILASVPDRYCDNGGILRPWKHADLPTAFQGKKHGTTFFAGFEQRVFSQERVPAKKPAAPKFERAPTPIPAPARRRDKSTPPLFTPVGFPPFPVPPTFAVPPPPTPTPVFPPVVPTWPVFAPVRAFVPPTIRLPSPPTVPRTPPPSTPDSMPDLIDDDLEIPELPEVHTPEYLPEIPPAPVCPFSPVPSTPDDCPPLSELIDVEDLAWDEFLREPLLPQEHAPAMDPWVHFG